MSRRRWSYRAADAAKGIVATIAHSLSDVVMLSLYYVLAFAFMLLTDPWLDLKGTLGSDGIDRLARSGEITWGFCFLTIGILGLVFARKRIFGLTAAFLLAGIRIYDMWNAPTGHNYAFVVGNIFFAILAVRGTIRRTNAYDLSNSS